MDIFKRLQQQQQQQQQKGQQITNWHGLENKRLCKMKSKIFYTKIVQSFLQPTDKSKDRFPLNQNWLCCISTPLTPAGTLHRPQSVVRKKTHYTYWLCHMPTLPHFDFSHLKQRLLSYCSSSSKLHLYILLLCHKDLFIFLLVVTVHLRKVQIRFTNTAD